MTFKSLIVGLIASAVLAGSAQAGGVLDESADAAALADWKRAAGKIISATMRYPVPVGKRELDDGSTTVTAIVKRDGTVVATELTRPSGDRYLDRASREFAENLEKLPPLPDAIATDGAKVHMHLLYAGSQDGLRQLQREIVRMRQIAEASEDEDRQIAETLDETVIDLFTGGA